MTDVLVEIQRVSKRFAPHMPFAVQEVSALIPRGKIVGLVGPDGAGKTTLIRLIAALLKPSSGSIRVEAHDTMLGAEAIHSLSGYMPQRFGLYEDLTVMQNLTLYADLRQVGKERADIFAHLLEFTGLQAFTKRLAGALSGGMKQKLGLACTLVKKPLLLLLDEPSVGVDPISRRELWKMVYDLRDEGISILWSTAYLNEAAQCDSVLLLNEGQLLFQGNPQDLTETVRGRTFQLPCTKENKRKQLFDVLEDKGVLDAEIQGSDVRIVLRKNVAKPPWNMVDIPPRFEDGFIDILGGGPGGTSILAETTPQIPKETSAVIEANQLTKKFGSFCAVNSITFHVQRGEVFGLLGPNGAGKSTTFKMLCGLLTPSAGSAKVNGKDLHIATAEARSHIGYMSQKFALYDTLSVLQNLRFFAGVYEASSDAIDTMIQIFNLKPYLNETSASLPLGFKQRLALACANMHHPAVLFLDEPTSGVDPITRREFWNHINGLVRKGVTIMVTTHFMDEAEYCDRIALIYQGKVINLNTPDALKAEVRSDQNPNPTLEDAFVHMIESYDAKAQ